MRNKMGMIAVFGAMLLGISSGVFAQHGGRGYGHGGHWHGGVGVYLGVPLYSPWYYPPAYYAPPYPYYYPPSVDSSPPAFVEQQAPAVEPAPQTNYWYYCGDSKAYYPYVKECPGGWQRVAPQPG